MVFGAKQFGSAPPSPAHARAARVMRSCSRFWPPVPIVPNAAAELGGTAVHATRSTNSSTVNRRRRTARTPVSAAADGRGRIVGARVSPRTHPAEVTGSPVTDDGHPDDLCADAPAAGDAVDPPALGPRTPARSASGRSPLSRARRPLALLAELLLEPCPRLRVLGLRHHLVAHLLPFRRTRELGHPLAELAHLISPLNRHERAQAADRRRSRPACARCRRAGRAPSPRATRPDAGARSVRAACEGVSGSGPAAPARPPHRRCRAGRGAPSRPRTRESTTYSAAHNRVRPRRPRSARAPRQYRACRC